MEDLFWFMFWLALCLLCGFGARSVSGRSWVGVITFVLALYLSPKIVGLVVAIAWLCKKFGSKKVA